MRAITLEIGRDGALVRVRLGLTDLQRRTLKGLGREPAPPQELTLVVDTGASHTFVDQSAMLALGVPPTNTHRFHSASTRGIADTCAAYTVGLQLGSAVGANVLRIEPLEVMAGMFVGDAYQGLLGRDVLNRMHLGWRGPGAFAELSFP